MGMLYPTAGRRNLVLETVPIIVYQTFQEAVVACALVTDQNEVITCFMDILYISTPSEKGHCS